LHSTSTRGRPPISPRGISSYRTTRPVLSFTDRAPTHTKGRPDTIPPTSYNDNAWQTLSF
jgi:hypothetical protein